LINLIEQEPVWWRNEGGQMIFEQDNMGKHVDANAGAYEVDELKAEVDFLMEENHSLSSEIEDLYDRANELEDTIRELQEEK
jgi:regulator of replication initiation timing